MVDNKQLSMKQKKMIILVITVLATYLGFKYLLPLFIPFLIAYFFAWILRPFVGFLRRRLKIPLIIGGSVGLILLISAVGSGLFYVGRLFMDQLVTFFRNFPTYQSAIIAQLEGLCRGCDKLLGLTGGTARTIMYDGMESMTNYVRTELLPQMTQQTIRIAIGTIELLAIILIIFVSTLLLIKDLDDYKAGFRKSDFYPAIHKVTSKLSETGVAYLKTQGILMLLIAAACTITLLILKNNYALLIGIGIAIFDAFPVLGSGLILVPWSLILCLQKDFTSAAILMTLFLVCQLIREFLEPKLLGNKIGIKPIFSMIAMYIGVQLFGLAGFFLGPLGLVIIKTVMVSVK